MKKQQSLDFGDDDLFERALAEEPPKVVDDAPLKAFVASSIEGVTIPEKFATLPVAMQLNKIDFVKKNIIVVAQTGSGKTILIPCVEALKLKAAGWNGQIWLRQPTRVAVRFIYSGLKRFWSASGLTFGISTRDEKTNVDSADIVVFSDGSLKQALSRKNERPLIVYFDEIHNMGSIATEIEIALCKKRGIPMRLLSATIDPEPLVMYLGGDALTHLPGKDTALYYLDGRTFPIHKRLREIDSRVFWRDDQEGFDDLMNECVEEVILSDERALFFVPTKKMAHDLAEKYADQIKTTFAHGEVNPADLEVWVEEHSNESFIIFATLVAATSITIDVGRVYIWDERIDGEIREGIVRSFSCRPDNNLLLQMAGRAGRVRAGTAILISTVTRTEDKENPEWSIPRDWDQIVPVPIATPGTKTTPYSVILALASHGVRADEDIDLISKLDPNELAHARQWLKRHGCLDVNNEITRLGTWIEHAPLDVPLAHFVLTGPTKETRLALAAAVAMNLKGAYQMVYMKPESAQLKTARLTKRNQWLQAEQERVKGKTDENGIPLPIGDPPALEALMPILPKDCVVPNSMPMTMARVIQRAYQARDRDNKAETLPDWCSKSNVNFRILRLVMRDFEEIVKHVSDHGKEEFLALDLNDEVLVKEVSNHVRSHDLFVQIRWDYKQWTTWRSYGAILDSVTCDVFGLQPGQTYAAIGMPKIIKAKKTGNQFVSLEFSTIVEREGQEW